MAAYQDPVALRRRLQRELRRYRSEAGKTQAAVAEAMDWSPSKVIRIENGAVAVATNDLRALLGYYQVTDPKVIEDFITLSKNSKQPSRWSKYLANDSISQESATYFGNEASANIIRQFEPAVLPGLIQTEEYMHALLSGLGFSGLELEQKVEARLARQEVFEENGPEAFFLLDEAVVRRNVGGPMTMKKQLEALLNLSKQSNVTIQIVPFSAGSYPGLIGPFSILEFTDDDPVLYLESRYETVTREDSDIIGRYLDTFQSMEREAATPPDQLGVLLKSMTNEA